MLHFLRDAVLNSTAYLSCFADIDFFFWFHPLHVFPSPATNRLTFSPPGKTLTISSTCTGKSVLSQNQPQTLEVHFTTMKLANVLSPLLYPSKEHVMESKGPRFDAVAEPRAPNWRLLDCQSSSLHFSEHSGPKGKSPRNVVFISVTYSGVVAGLKACDVVRSSDFPM